MLFSTLPHHYPIVENNNKNNNEVTNHNTKTKQKIPKTTTETDDPIKAHTTVGRPIAISLFGTGIQETKLHVNHNVIILVNCIIVA